MGNTNSMVRKSAISPKTSTEIGGTSQVVLSSIILASNAKLLLRHILALVQDDKGYVYSFSVCNRSLVRSIVTLLTIDSGIRCWCNKMKRLTENTKAHVLATTAWPSPLGHQQGFIIPEEKLSCYKSKLTILDSNLGSVRFCTLLANCCPDFQTKIEHLFSGHIYICDLKTRCSS